MELRKKPRIEDAFKEGLLSAHKMQIVKHSKREKNSAKYLLMKEILRDKVVIQRDGEGFQIVVPKALRSGKAPLPALDADEFAKHFHVFKLNIKDMVKLIRDQAARNNALPADGETVITKEQVAAFLKKNLRKLLKEQDPAGLRKSKALEESLRKTESVQARRLLREKEKMLRSLQKEEELLSKRERAKIDRLLAPE